MNQDRITFETVIASTARTKIVIAEARVKANQRGSFTAVLPTPLHNVRK